MKTRLVILSVLVAAFVLLVGALVGVPAAWAGGPRYLPAAGTTITVTTAVDDFTTNGNCSLREAIEAANTDAAVDNCPAGSGADTIRLPRQIYALTLTGSESATGTNNAFNDLDIVSDLTLRPVGCVGLGCFVTPIIQAGAGWSHRLLEVSGPYVVTLSGLVLQNGAANTTGGGIYNTEADLTLSGSAVYSSTADNNGGGIDNEGGSLTLINAIVQANGSQLGGGIYTTGTLTLIASTVESNTAFNVGGIDLAGGALEITGGAIRRNTATNGPGGLSVAAGQQARLTGVEISQNTATTGAGGLALAAGASVTLTGGTVFSNSFALTNLGGTLIISATTISRNQQGVSSNGGPTTIADSTISGNNALGNGGGIYVSNSQMTIVRSTGGRLTVISSTVSGNSTPESGGGLTTTGSDASATILASLFVDNTATLFAGGIDAGTPVTITNSTLSGNRTNGEGGGMFVAIQAFLSNDTIANNVADS
ncbi:MAG: CSLREA domain-containing protein, partial [Anaerolineales bacterium]